MSLQCHVKGDRMALSGWLPFATQKTLLPPCDSWHLVQSNRSNLGVQKTKRTATMTLFRKSNSFLRCSSLFPIIIKLWNMFQLSLSSSMLSIDPVLFHLQVCQVPGLSIHLPPDPKQHAPECSGSPPAIWNQGSGAQGVKLPEAKVGNGGEKKGELKLARRLPEGFWGATSYRELASKKPKRWEFPFPTCEPAEFPSDQRPSSVQRIPWSATVAAGGCCCQSSSGGSLSLLVPVYRSWQPISAGCWILESNFQTTSTARWIFIDFRDMFFRWFALKNGSLPKHFNFNTHIISPAKNAEVETCQKTWIFPYKLSIETSHPLKNQQILLRKPWASRFGEAHGSWTTCPARTRFPKARVIF